MAAPTTDDIYNNLVAQMQSAMNQRIPSLPKSFLRVWARSVAAVFTILYKYGGFQFLQIFVATATLNDTEILGRTISPLKEWGRLIGAGDPKLATAAELRVEVTVTTQSGQIPLGTQFTGVSNGVLYLSTQSVPLDAATVYVNVVAASDASGGSGAGVIGNLAPGAAVTFVTPIAQANRTTLVTETVETGTEAETPEAYRQRVVDWFQKRPQGGAYADYEEWAELTPGVVAAYPYTGLIPGTVDVYIEAADMADGIPDAALIQAARDNIELDEDGKARRRPVGAFVTVKPIVRSTFVVQVFGLDVTDPGSVQSQITQAVQDYFLSREPYIPGVSVPPRNDRITQSAISGIVDDIVASVGGIFSNVTVSRAGIQFALYALDIGEKAKATVSYL